MPKFFMLGIALFLFLAAAGYGITTLQARSIPWDCTDWQAFAHDDRTTAILESLAENRGKTLYCGIDQSDTFTKAETWEAGKDRNERDDTVYFGERGQFRGFIAAQEGWLTDGESGVTGVSIDRIFEFPREERRRVKRVKRYAISSGPLATDTCPDPEDGRQPGTLACSGWGGIIDNAHGSAATSRRRSMNRYVRVTGETSSGWRINWETQALTGNLSGFARPNTEQWLELAETQARAVCRAQHGGTSVSNVAIGRGHNREVGNTDQGHSDFTGEHLGWFFDNTHATHSQHRARQSRSWTATCKKTIRRTRK